MPVAAGSPWLLPFFLWPLIPMTFPGVSPRPFPLCQCWSGSCGVDYFFAHLAFLVPQLPRHFHFLPPPLLVLRGRKHFCRQQGGFVCLAGSTETQERWGKGWKICGCQLLRRSDLDGGKVINKCAQMTPSVFHNERGSLSERNRSSIAGNSPVRLTDSSSHLQAMQQGQRINTSLSVADDYFKGCFSS